MKIGIPASPSKTQYFINQAYVNYVSEAGFSPVLLTQELDKDIAIGLIDGLLLPGGIDLDPIYYGHDNYSSLSADPEKDEFERCLFHTARKKGIPIFGICRGLQLIAMEYIAYNKEVNDIVAFSFHIPEHSQTEKQGIARSSFQHFVSYYKVLYGMDKYDIDNMPVNSMHHQGLISIKDKNDKPAKTDNFEILAWTERGLKTPKGEKYSNIVCEAFRILNWGASILTVQWHPEELSDYTLIQNFFNKETKNDGILCGNIV